MKTNQTIRRILTASVMIPICCQLAPSADAATLVQEYTVNVPIPDNSLTGVFDTRVVSTPIISITDISVSFAITGGFNGDYYAYLTHGSGFVVLLNRSGRTLSDTDGHPDAGFDVVFERSAANGDIHQYRDVHTPTLGAPLTGIWEADGRNVLPAGSYDTTPRTATLDSFIGLDPNGEWTLFVADASAVGVGTFDSWALNITGIVPEPSSAALAVLAAAALLLRRRRD